MSDLYALQKVDGAIRIVLTFKPMLADRSLRKLDKQKLIEFFQSADGNGVLFTPSANGETDPGAVFFDGIVVEDIIA